MHIFSIIAGAWMSLLVLFGLAHPNTEQTPPIGVSAQAQAPSATAAPQAQNAPAEALQSQTQTQPQTQPAQPEPAAALGLPQSGSPYLTSVTLGDGKYTTSGPKQGYIYVCHVASGGEGAQGNPTWIHGSTWDPKEKVSVSGSVSWPNASYSMSVSGATRLIKANGLPTDHTSGTFPIKSSDPAYQFDKNPNSIQIQSYSFSLPAAPTMLAEPGCIYGEVGIMNDGVPLFDGFDAEYRDAVAHETQDAYEAHPDEQGVYHYHGFESGYLNDPVSQVVGFAFDGYPITGGMLPDGTYVTSAQLDECHGLTSAVMLDGNMTTTYHYVLTQDFPYSVSCFRGKSYEPKPGGGAQTQTQSAPMQQTQSQSGTPPAPPQAAVDACTGKSEGASCTVSGGPSGTCAVLGGELACKPQ